MKCILMNITYFFLDDCVDYLVIFLKEFLIYNFESDSEYIFQITN